MREVVIGGTVVNDDSPAYVIAEIGNNHQGRTSDAIELIAMAHRSGAQAVKFQVRDNRAIYTRAMFDEPYDSPNSFGPTYGQHREALELSHDAHRQCRDYAESYGLTWFATPFDFGSADFLASLDVPVFKIASGDLTNIPLIKHVAAFGKPMIVSTGGADLSDVDRAVSLLLTRVPLCVMQCTSAYPPSAEMVNLLVIQTYRERYPDVVIGYSGHAPSTLDAKLAYLVGAGIIEKHVTLDHRFKGTDQRFSLIESELSDLTRWISEMRPILGDGIKRRLPAEDGPMRKMQKSLYAARDLPAGHVLTADDIAIKSPGGGLPPYMLDTIIGLRLADPMAEEDQFTARTALEQPLPLVAAS